MTSIIRKTLATAIAAAALAVTFQPVSASAGGGFAPNPHVVKPCKFCGPGTLKPGLGKPGKPGKGGHHHHHNNGAAAAMGLVGGMIIGSAIANSQNRQPVYTGGSSNAHVAWCLDRYRSYDIPTDTYMSHSGYRKYCNSPYN